jgi:hypothetical protein
LRETPENLKPDNQSDNLLLIYTRNAVMGSVMTRSKRAKSTPKELWEKCFAQNTGKTWKQLTEFPGRIRRMAKEIELIHRSYVFDPERLTSKASLVMYAKREFPILPVILGNYAHYLEIKVIQTSAKMKRFYSRTPRGMLSPFILDVSKQVKIITGRYHDRLVADLLNAADLVLNPDVAKTGPRFFEQPIVLVRSRQKRKSTQS